MYRINMVLVTGMAVMLGGCAAKPSMSKDFGVSTSRNIAAQTLDAKAADRDMIPPSVDGMKAEKALERYRKDKPTDSRAKLLEETGGN